MRGVHIGLDLEDHAGEFGLFGLHRALDGRALAGRRCQVDQSVEHLAHAEVVDRRAKQHRGLLAVQKLGLVERRRSARDQFELVLGLGELGAEALQTDGVVQTHEHLFFSTTAVFTGGEHAHLVGAAVVDAAKGLAHAHGPRKGHHGHAEFAFDLVHQVQRRLHLAVHFVDEGQDGRVAGAANLQQAAGLGLHAVARVDHHERGVHRGEHAVGVF